MPLGRTHNVEAKHIKTKSTQEVFLGQIAWKGEIEVFSVEYRSVATRCHGWGYPSDANPQADGVWLGWGISPIDSPARAVEAGIRTCIKRIRNLPDPPKNQQKVTD